jgi:hypothetical protein
MFWSKFWYQYKAGEIVELQVGGEWRRVFKITQRRFGTYNREPTTAFYLIFITKV